jgi:cell pole-organizing protein PopZ
MSDAEVSHLQNQDLKLEDILKSIRGVIDNHNDALKTEVRAAGDNLEEKEDQILELTSIFYPADSVLNKEEDDRLISEGAKLEALSKIKDFSNKIEKNGYSSNTKNENSIDNMALSIMKPLIKEWVDNNLSKLVEKVISEEIKQLIPKKN